MADIQAQLNRVREAANDVAGTAAEKLKDGTSRARDGAGELIQTGKDAVSDAKDKASATYSEARDKGLRVAARANEIVQEHPIAAAAAAVAAGAVLAYLFPKSRAAMKRIPGVASALGARAVEAALAARSVVEEGSESVKTRAGDAFVAARDGASKAGDAFSAAKDSAVKAELGAKASQFADDALALVVEKAEALTQAIKSKLPKK